MIIGIMGAMPDEVDQLCARLENVTKENYAGVEYHCGTLQGKQVVVCCAGMGKANAASTVQVLCTKYGIDKLIFSGIAGNMTSRIGIGDVCVGETVVYHDAELSMIAQSAPFQTEYHGDPALVQAALDACTACGVKAIAGKIATGDTFVGDAETKKAIEEKCHPGLRRNIQEPPGQQDGNAYEERKASIFLQESPRRRAFCRIHAQTAQAPRRCCSPPNIQNPRPS